MAVTWPRPKRRLDSLPENGEKRRSAASAQDGVETASEELAVHAAKGTSKRTSTICLSP